MKRPKRLMLLGGIRYLLPVIQAAHEQGYYVITADYLPDNIAHRYSDEYVNVSIIDQEAVLQAAREKQIDGILSFGVDLGVVAASYVQNQLGLPSFGPYESVEILQNKDKFRAFLTAHGFNVPWAFGFSSSEEAWKSRSKFSYPLIVKPTDSAGSKGVTKVTDETRLKDALAHAFRHSIKGNIIIEEFIKKQGCSSDCDCFSENGQLKVVTFSAQRFDVQAAGEFVPAAYSWPSTMSKQQEAELHAELQRLLSLLHMQTSVYNVESRIGVNGKAYLMEVSPRGGGNRLSEMIRYATGVDMITAAVRAAVGDPIGSLEQQPYRGHWAEIVLHSNRTGIFDSLYLSEELPAEVVESDLWVKQGDAVEAFVGANNAIGMLILKFASREALEEALKTQNEWLKINILEQA